MFDRCFDELSVGDRATYGGVTITDAHILGFAGVTGDHFGLHTDSVYAASSPFGQRVAHGLLVLSCGAGLVPLGRGVVLALLGINDVRFTAPTFVGDTINPSLEVVELREHPQGGIVTAAETITKQDGTVVCTATIKVLLGRSPIGS